jgi:hypothetical protein
LWSASLLEGVVLHEHARPSAASIVPKMLHEKSGHLFGAGQGFPRTARNGLAIDGTIDLLRGFYGACRDEFEEMRAKQF